MKFVLGTVFGIVLASIGFTGLATLADRAVDGVKKTATQQVQPR